MTGLPVVGRELRVASRRPSNYWARTIAAGVAVGVCGWILLMNRNSGLAWIGKEIFGAVSFLSFGYALLAGVVFSADSLAAERREGTLGLLFLTDLRGHDVLFGKLAASSLGCVFQLGATLPVLAMTMLLGAVSFPEYCRMILVLGSTLFLSLSLGMFASTLSADAKRSAVAAFGLMACVAGAVPALGGIGVFLDSKIAITGGVGDALWEEYCSWASPVPLYWWSFDSTYNAGSSGHFWKSLGFVWATSGFCLAWGSRRLPRLWQTGGETAAWRGIAARIAAWQWPTAGERSGFRTRLLEESPMVWLAGRRWMAGWWVWIFLAAVAFGFGVIALIVGSDWLEAGAFFATSLLVHTTMKIWIASEAPRQFLDDRRSGAMEMLLPTSMDAGEWVHGRMRALRRQFELPGLTVVFADLLFLAFGIPSMGVDGGARTWLLLGCARISLFVLDGYALAWTGMWVGLSARGSRTTLTVLWRIILLPWLVMVGISTLCALPLGERLSFEQALGIWWVVCAVIATGTMQRSRSRLLSEFREHAGTRPGDRKTTPAPP